MVEDTDFLVNITEYVLRFSMFYTLTLLFFFSCYVFVVVVNLLVTVFSMYIRYGTLLMKLEFPHGQNNIETVLFKKKITEQRAQFIIEPRKITSQNKESHWKVKGEVCVYSSGIELRMYKKKCPTEKVTFSKLQYYCLYEKISFLFSHFSIFSFKTERYFNF